jgi:hypothetical protein
MTKITGSKTGLRVMAQVAHLPIKCKVLSSTPNTTEKEKNKTGRDRARDGSVWGPEYARSCMLW